MNLKGFWVLLGLIGGLGCLHPLQAQHPSQPWEAPQELCRRGEWSAAVTAFRAAGSPSDWPAAARFNFGLALYHTGEYAAAVDEFSAASASPDRERNAVSEMQRGHASLAAAWETLADAPATAKTRLEQARAAYQNSLRLQPDLAASREGLTRTLHWLERLQRSEPPAAPPPPESSPPNEAAGNTQESSEHSAESDQSSSESSPSKPQQEQSDPGTQPPAEKKSSSDGSSELPSAGAKPPAGSESPGQEAGETESEQDQTSSETNEDQAPKQNAPRDDNSKAETRSDGTESSSTTQDSRASSPSSTATPDGPPSSKDNSPLPSDQRLPSGSPPLGQPADGNKSTEPATDPSTLQTPQRNLDGKLLADNANDTNSPAVDPNSTGMTSTEFMTLEEARRMLQEVRDRELLRKQLKRRPRRPSSQVEKDW